MDIGEEVTKRKAIMLDQAHWVRAGVQNGNAYIVLVSEYGTIIDSIAIPQSMIQSLADQIDDIARQDAAGAAAKTRRDE